MLESSKLGMPTQSSNERVNLAGPMAALLTLTLALSHRGRGDTAAARPLWIPACAGMTVAV